MSIVSAISSLASPYCLFFLYAKEGTSKTQSLCDKISAENPLVEKRRSLKGRAGNLGTSFFLLVPIVNYVALGIIHKTGHWIGLKQSRAIKRFTQIVQDSTFEKRKLDLFKTQLNDLSDVENFQDLLELFRKHLNSCCDLELLHTCIDDLQNCCEDFTKEVLGKDLDLFSKEEFENIKIFVCQELVQIIKEFSENANNLNEIEEVMDDIFGYLQFGSFADFDDFLDHVKGAVKDSSSIGKESDLFKRFVWRYYCEQKITTLDLGNLKNRILVFFKEKYQGEIFTNVQDILAMLYLHLNNYLDFESVIDFSNKLKREWKELINEILEINKELFNEDEIIRLTCHAFPELFEFIELLDNIRDDYSKIQDFLDSLFEHVSIDNYRNVDDLIDDVGRQRLDLVVLKEDFNRFNKFIWGFYRNKVVEHFQGDTFDHLKFVFFKQKYQRADHPVKDFQEILDYLNQLLTNCSSCEDVNEVLIKLRVNCLGLIAGIVKDNIRNFNEDELIYSAFPEMFGLMQFANKIAEDFKKIKETISQLEVNQFVNLDDLIKWIKGELLLTDISENQFERCVAKYWDERKLKLECEHSDFYEKKIRILNQLADVSLENPGKIIDYLKKDIEIIQNPELLSQRTGFLRHLATRSVEQFLGVSAYRTKTETKHYSTILVPELYKLVNKAKKIQEEFRKVQTFIENSNIHKFSSLMELFASIKKHLKLTIINNDSLIGYLKLVYQN